MKVEQIVPKSNSIVDLQEYISELASVVRDKQPKSAEKLFGRLLVESIGKTASRVLEYIPCKLEAQPALKLLESTTRFQFFGFFKDGHYYTNARELLNWGSTFEQIIESNFIDFTNYKVYKCEAPYFIYGQVSTHNQLTTVSHSQRYSDCDRGYWKPPEVSTLQENWDTIVNTFPPYDLKQYMKDCGIKRKEVWDRGADMLQNRVFTIGGYTNNPYGWEHFFKQRLDKHTQLETREIAELLFNT